MLRRKEVTTDLPNQRLRRALLGYRRTEVEVALAELRLTLRHFQEDLAETRERAKQTEVELRDARIELDTRRAREHEVEQALDAAEQRMRDIEQAAAAQARTILAEAEEQAARTRTDAHLRTEVISQQVDELLRLRDTLVQTMRGVIRDFDYAVERVEKGESVLPEEPTPVPQLDQLAPGPDGEPRPARQRAAGDEQQFEGRVELDAGPFGDFAALSAFERSLAKLQGVEDVYVRRFAGDRALIELTLAQPLALVGAMRDFLPYGLEIEKLEQGRISITVAIPTGAF